MKPGVLLVRNAAEADELAGQVRASATKLQAWIASSFGGDGIGLLRALKFNQVGFHPLDGHALNAIEQVNQIWTGPRCRRYVSCSSSTRTPAASPSHLVRMLRSPWT